MGSWTRGQFCLMLLMSEYCKDVIINKRLSETTLKEQVQAKLYRKLEAINTLYSVHIKLKVTFLSISLPRMSK